MKRNPTIDLGDGITIEQVPEGVDPRAFLQAVMDDCPECQQARARGETPTFIEVPPPPRSSPFARPPRWRTRK